MKNLVKLSFSEFVLMKDFHANQLCEKQILYNNGKKYGQIVFLAGGAGSGKGFAIKNFMSGSDFKVRDVDEMKLAFQKLDSLQKFTTKDLLAKYGDKISDKDRAIIDRELTNKDLGMSDLNLKTPTHVYILHVLVRATGVKDKTLDLMLDGAEKGTLPNIIFDSTFKDITDMTDILPKLFAAGYEEKNIHVTWVLTNYQIAIKNNKSRARVVPDDVLLATHKGAAQTVYGLVTHSMPKEVQGGIYVILNNPENTVVVIDPKTNKPYKNMHGDIVVKDFKYLTLKEPGKPAKKEIEIKKQLLTWIKDNTPEGSVDTSELDKL
jgi:hypothetical protein